MKGMRVCAAGVALLLVLLASCGSVAGCHYSESILFSDLLSGNVYLACPDGSRTVTLLARTSTTGFEQAVGLSLMSPIVFVGLDETAPSPTSTERLEIYDQAKGQISKFLGLPGESGWPSEAPDGRHVAFEYFPHPGPGAGGGLWVADTVTGQASALLVSPADTQINASTWRPDGGEILYVQLNLQTYPNLTTSLVAVSYPAGETRTLFGHKDFVVGAAFAPDGKHFAIWSPRGIEIVDESTLQRRIVVPVDNLGGRLLNTSGLIWGARDNLIAVVLQRPGTNRSELWDVRPDGTGLCEVYSVTNGHLALGSFVAGPWSAARPYPGS